MKAEVGVTPLTKTLFDLAVEHDAVDAVSEDLEVVQRTIDHHLKLKDALRNTQVGFDFKKKLIADVFQGKVSFVTMSFLKLLVEVGTISGLPAIRKGFAAMSAESRKRVTADVTTAVPMDSTLEDSVRKQLASYAGKQILIRHHIDPAIIGGVVVKLDGEILDASISRQLSALRAQLGGTRK